MKNIRIELVGKVQELVNDYKGYRELYNQTQEFAVDRSTLAYDDILCVIKHHIEDVCGDIAYYLSELYDDWTGVSEAYKVFWKKCGTTKSTADWWNTKDKIQEKYENEGKCLDIIGIPDGELCVSITYIAISFMKQFISEYGMFKMNCDGDVEIL